MQYHEIPVTIMQNGRIFLFDDGFNVVESLVIRGEHVLAVGSNQELEHVVGSNANIIDLEGRTVIPGLIDAHIHMQKYSLQRMKVDCETETLEECLERVRSRVQETPPGHWVNGHGWNQNKWERFGNTIDLDNISTHHPIYLTAKSLHAAWVNTEALKLCRLDSTAEDPPGGEIQRHENGQPTGILFEKAMELVSSKIPKPSVDELAERVNEAQQVLWKMGITSIHDFDKSSAFSAFQRIHNRGELGLRVIKNISYKNLDEAIALGLRTGFGDAWLRIGHIKFYVDGALGPMTAAMIDSYEDSSDNFGLLRTGGEELTDMTFNAVKSGLAVSVHAIGDRANRITLDVFQAVREAEKSNNLPHLRHRIEHLQLLHPDDVHRPASLGVVASMQPYHATSDMEMAQNLWGKRSRLSYAWNSQLKAGAVLAFGSDAPVEIPNPFLGIHAAVTRKRLDGTPGPEGWIPEERISLKDTLFAYTRGPAYTAGLEKQQGMLKPGYFADLITLDTDPFTCPEDDLPQIAPVATMVGGQWKYRAF